jgi:DNA-binding transcriptional MerR regulator
MADDPLGPMPKTVVEAQQTPDIPDKLYFRIGEVSRLVGVLPYVLRFWESEFPALAPKKSGTGHRLYRRKDVELLLEIKQLLYDKRFTIEGARRHLEVRGKPARRERAAKPKVEQGDLFGTPPAGALAEVRKELASILALLK